MVTREEVKKAYEKMRSLAHQALSMADRCHGGHSYESIRSTEAGKCCEARMEVDDLKKEYLKVVQEMDKRELPQRKSR